MFHLTFPLTIPRYSMVKEIDHAFDRFWERRFGGVPPSGYSERLTFRVTRTQSPQIRPFEFDLTPRQAMILMRSLQAYQRRYRWPVPMIPALERLFRQDN
jgi:hypothetical protein